MNNSKTSPGQADDATDGPEAPLLPEDVQNFLGKKLRNHYRDLISEPLPDRFAALLAELSEVPDDKKKGSE